MKGHKSVHHGKHKAKGGSTGGVDEAMQDLEHNPEARDNAHEIEHEAEEKEGLKKGGRAKRKPGGMLMHKAKHVGHMHGEEHKHHAGRKPRKSGGRAGVESHPFSSALHGTPAKGRKLEKETMGADE